MNNNMKQTKLYIRKLKRKIVFSIHIYKKKKKTEKRVCLILTGYQHLIIFHIYLYNMRRKIYIIPNYITCLLVIWNCVFVLLKRVNSLRGIDSGYFAFSPVWNDKYIYEDNLVLFLFHFSWYVCFLNNFFIYYNMYVYCILIWCEWIYL